MTDDEQIRSYMRRVQSSLHVRKAQRLRVLEEIENHLQEGAAELMRGGTTRAQAVADAIEELGPPETVAAAFSDEGPPVPPTTGLVRWLPMLVPLVLLTAAVASSCGASPCTPAARRAANGPSNWLYLRAGVVFAFLSYGVYQSIKRADRDSAWRWAAWACAGAQRRGFDRSATSTGLPDVGHRGTPSVRSAATHCRHVAKASRRRKIRVACREPGDGVRPARDGGQQSRSDEGDQHG